MTQNLPPDFLRRARQILLPFVATEVDREALLTEAFFLHNPQLYGIERGGEAKIFALNCLKTLLAFGCLAPGEHSLSRLLLTAKYDCKADQHAEIDELIQIANALCSAGQQVAKPAAPLVFPEHPAPLQTVATPRDERCPTVFLSYSHQDKDFAQRLITDLRAAGHACWIDTSSIRGGEEWILAISDGIINSYAMVVIVTLEALQSRWVRKELAWAESNNRLIIPLMLEDVFKEPLFFLLANYQAVTCFGGDYAAALQKLLAALPSPVLPAIEADDSQESAPAPQPATVSASRSVPRALELAYLERLRFEELLSTEKYTPLGGTAQQQVKRAEMRAIFELLPMGKDRQLLHETHRFENAVEEILTIRRAVLLGEPGGGKTTTIWKLAADLVATAIQDRQAPLPLLIRLGRWTEAEQSLPEFIASQLGDLGAHLDVLLHEQRAALLLDGLNELPASQHAEKYPQVQRFIAQHPKLLAIVSCRELDYTLDLGFDRINITPLDPLRIREFAGRYLGEEKGEALFWRLAGGAEVQAVWEVWQKAGASFDLFWTAPDIPKENPNVYGATTGQHDNLWREKVRSTHTLMELARNPYMLLMLTSVYAEQGTLPDNRGELFQLFVQTLLRRERIPAEEQTPLTDALARVAYEMQIRRAQDEQGDALTVLTKDEVTPWLDERLLYLAGSASILSIGEQVRFTHQLLQEYFAAKYMDNEMRTGRLHATDIWPPERWWQRTNWEEAAILLAGLYSDDCTPVVEWLAEANPEVAAQCITRSGAALSPACRERLRALWLPRLTDLQHEPEPQARAAVGRALGQTGLDNRKGLGIRDVRGVTLPDIDWIEIPEGKFQYGKANDTYTAEPQTLFLPTFYLSRYPVTYVQFQTFLDDPEGFANPQWFAGLAASEYERRMEEQYFKFANHPREMVNWYQAIAFCRWFSSRLGSGYELNKVDEWAVRLPTEFEWEKAARGIDGRLYPYQGDYDPAKGNTRDTKIKQTNAVGIFPHGASPYGVQEMSGNVWEWCLSNYDKPAPEARKENLRNEANRVLRGGSWILFNDLARAVSRHINFPPSDRYNGFGFRVSCAGRPPS
jgi:formylglycine-generating enzyme required for sulfatase activity